MNKKSLIKQKLIFGTIKIVPKEIYLFSCRFSKFYERKDLNKKKVLLFEFCLRSSACYSEKLKEIWDL